MIRGIKIRLFPTPEQEQVFWKRVNAVRFVYNWGLAENMRRFSEKEPHLSSYELRNLLREKIKIEENLMWLDGIGVTITSVPLFDLGEAYGRFFNHLKSGKPKFSDKKLAKLARKDKKPTVYDMQCHPKFKSKIHAKVSFPARADRTTFKEKKGDLLVTLEGCGKVKFQTDRDFSIWKKVSDPRVTYEYGKWLLTFGVEMFEDLKKPILNDFCMGVDVGVKDLAIINTPSETKVFKNINKTKAMKKREKRQKRLDRAVSRKEKGSKNQQKARELASKIKRKTKNIRNTYTHQVSRNIVNYLPKRIGIEDLNIKGMMVNRNLAKAIQDASLSELIRQIEYKSEYQGIEIVKAERWYPSSKKCSGCGYIKKDLKLSNRVYVCDSCGLVIDRDENASINLRHLAESA